MSEGVPFVVSHGNALDHIRGDLPVAPVVKPGGTRVGMPGEALHVFERHALFEQIGNGGEPPLHHAAHVIHMNLHPGELLLSADRALK